MGIKIEDGTGGGYGAEVNKRNQQVTFSNTRPLVAEAAELENCFSFATDFFTVSAAGEHLVYEIQNSATDRFHIEDVRVSNSHPAIWRIYRNPNPGSGLSTSGQHKVVNCNFGASKTFVGGYLAPSAATIDEARTSGGTLAGQFQTDRLSELRIDGAYLLDQGNRLSVTCDISADVCATRIGSTVIGYYATDT